MPLTLTLQILFYLQSCLFYLQSCILYLFQNWCRYFQKHIAWFQWISPTPSKREIFPYIYMLKSYLIEVDTLFPLYISTTTSSFPATIFLHQYLLCIRFHLAYFRYSLYSKNPQHFNHPSLLNKEQIMMMALWCSGADNEWNEHQLLLLLHLLYIMMFDI